MKRLTPLEKFGRIVDEHFANVSRDELNRRLYEASHGEFGVNPPSRAKVRSSVVKRAVRKSGQPAGRKRS
jgi:hypothetical protein